MRNWKTALFMAVMAAASGLTILKLGLLAIFLSKSDFTFYTSLFTASIFGSSLVSFGAIERSVKKFVHLIHANAFGEAAHLFRTIAWQMLRRHLLVLIVMLVGAALSGRKDWMLPLTGAVCASLATTIFGLAASLFRSLDLMLALAIATVVRTVSSLMIVTAAAKMQSDWFAVFAYETIGLLIIAAATMFWLDRRIAAAMPGEKTTAIPAGIADPALDPALETRNQFYLFLAFLILTAPPNLDRAAITSMAPVGEAARYAFLAIWMTATFTFAGIYVQKAGPDFIRQTLNGGAHALLKTCLSHAGVLFLLNVGLAAAGFMACYLLTYETAFLKFELDAHSISLAVLASAMQFTPILDWALIAQDREKQLLVASSVFVAAWGLSLLAALALGYGTGGFLAAMIIGRMAQVSMQVAYIRQPVPGKAVS